jgi:hypothetical protein
MAKRKANTAISTAVEQLKQEHIRLCKELERVDAALSALGTLDGAQYVSTDGRKAAVKPRKTRKISAAARKKMSEAARARWAARRKAAGKEKAQAK